MKKIRLIKALCVMLACLLLGTAMLPALAEEALPGEEVPASVEEERRAEPEPEEERREEVREPEPEPEPQPEPEPEPEPEPQREPEQEPEPQREPEPEPEPVREKDPEPSVIIMPSGDSPMAEEAPAAEPAEVWREEQPREAEAVYEEEAAEESEALMAAAVRPEDCSHPATRRVINREAKRIEYTDLKDGTHLITGKAVAQTVCTICGKVLESSDSIVENCEYIELDEAGRVCVYCDHVEGDDGRHTHSFTDGPYYFKGDYVDAVISASEPGLYHVDRYAKLMAYKCTECETYSPAALVAGEYIEENAYHLWDGDTCAVCGYKRSCKHDGGVIEDVSSRSGIYEFHSASGHNETTYTYTQKLCALCGEPMGDVEVTETVDLMPHIFGEDGVCTACGFKNICPHANMEYTYYEDSGRFTPVDARYHISAGQVGIRTEYCPVCDYYREYAPGLRGLRLRAELRASGGLTGLFHGSGQRRRCPRHGPGALDHRLPGRGYPRAALLLLSLLGHRQGLRLHLPPFGRGRRGAPRRGLL